MMRVNDYVLTEKYVQKYIGEYIVKPDIDLDSGHLILITSLNTPVTSKTCKRPKRNAKTKPLNLKLLQNIETKRPFGNAIKNP